MYKIKIALSELCEKNTSLNNKAETLMMSHKTKLIASISKQEIIHN